jgi:hypothetical protein
MGQELINRLRPDAVSRFEELARRMAEAQSPMPVSQGEQTAALLPGSGVVIVPAAGHLPCTSSPAEWPARCPGSAAWRAIWNPPDNGIQSAASGCPGVFSGREPGNNARLFVTLRS